MVSIPIFVMPRIPNIMSLKLSIVWFGSHLEFQDGGHNISMTNNIDFMYKI